MQCAAGVMVAGVTRLVGRVGCVGVRGQVKGWKDMFVQLKEWKGMFSTKSDDETRVPSREAKEGKRAAW